MVEDLRSAKNEVVIVINNYDEDRFKKLISYCEEKVTIYSSKDIDGIDVKKTSFQTNIIIIDNRIVWYGGINPFTFFQYGMDIMRIDDKAVADDLMKDIRK